MPGTSIDTSDIARARPAAEAAAGPDENLLSRVLDELDHAVILLDPSGQLLLANEEAWQMLRRGEVFALTEGRPQPVDPLQWRAWRAMLQDAQRRERPLGVFGGAGGELSVAMVALRTPPGEPRRPILLASFGRRHACAPDGVRAYARSRSLTPSECRVLEALVAGRAPQEIATEHGVAISTVRTQIKNVLVKTGTTGMRELLTQVARLAPLRPATAERGAIASRTAPS
jgi:DNA-binding CsgD family transcriptional regulator